MRQQQDETHFTESDIEKITHRFSSFTSDGCMTPEQFKTSMGLLGIGDAEYLSNRIFSLITNASYCTCEQFVDFLDKINHGTPQQKLQLSFHYLDHQHHGNISYSDIEVIVNEVSFVWNFLTGQKISTAQSIEWLCSKLGISQTKPLTFNDYLTTYDQEFNWYDFFNNPAQNSKTQNDKMHYASIRNSNNQFKIDQIEQYLKLVHQEVEELLHQFNEQQSFELCEGRELIHQTPTLRRKGPRSFSQQELQPRGDQGYNYRDTIPYLSQEQLTKELNSMHEQGNVYQLIASKLEHISEMSTKLFTNKQIIQSARDHGRENSRDHRDNREKTSSRSNAAEEQRKKILKNITKPPKKRRNIIYFGHQNWNIMLNMMLGVRRSLKSHYYKYAEPVLFTEQDIHCKYYHELIYKRNDKSIKQISEIFVDYSPKIFFYIRKYFNIDNSQFLKSIGLQTLLGNLLMGNLSTLSDQTSQGKSGSFIYYTDDSRIIVKSISRQEYLKLRTIVQDYVNYVRDNPNTYLMKIYGLYKMKNKSSHRSIYFIVIGNVFDMELQIDQRYDIKGATYGRQILQTEEETVENNTRDKNIALKDVDLINNHNRTFDIELDLKEKIFKQILKDAQFLKNHNIIEYSLLIGIHYVNQHHTYKPAKEPSLFYKQKLKSREVLSKNKKEVYFFGIIDLLSEYTTARRLQSSFFNILNYDISCKDPEQYYQRFKNFIYKYVFSN